MKEPSNQDFNKLIFYVSLIIGLLTVSEVVAPEISSLRMHISMQAYIISRVIFVGIPISLCFINAIEPKDKILYSIWNYGLYSAFYQIALDNSYYFVEMQLLAISLLFFIHDQKYFAKAFWPVQIIVNTALFFSNEMSLIKEGQSFVPNLLIIGGILSLITYLTQRSVGAKQQLALEEIETLAKQGMLSSFFLHEVKGHATGNQSLRSLVDTFYETETAVDQVAPRDVVEKQTAATSEFLREQGIIVENNLDPEFMLPFNLNHLTVIISNLFKNAVEELYEEDLKGSICFNQLENGFSITNPVRGKKNIKRLFDIHYSSKSTSTNKGLGLALVRDFCQKNQANVYAQSIGDEIIFSITQNAKKK